MAVKIVEPVALKDRLRHAAIEWARGIYHVPGRAAFRRRLAGIPLANSSEPRVNFGWLSAGARPADSEIGGAVKLRHLRERFGECERSFNVLYLVSSVIHLVPHVRTLVRDAKARGAKLVWNQNGVAYPAWCGSGYPWFNEPMRELLHEADFVVFQSAFCREAAQRYLGNVSVPSTVLWNPVDISIFVPGEAPAPKPWQLLAMGTNHSFYRVKSSLECLCYLIRRGIDVELTIAGEMRWENGDTEVSTFLRRNDLSERVRLRPRFTQDEAPALYRSSHVLLHPKYKDPCPTVPIEAMACGIPVVGSRSGGMPELVTRDVGRLVDIENSWTVDLAPDPDAMADAVCEIMGNREAYSMAARRRAVECFDRKTWVDRHEQIFRDLRQ